MLSKKVETKTSFSPFAYPRVFLRNSLNFVIPKIFPFDKETSIEARDLTSSRWSLQSPEILILELKTQFDWISLKFTITFALKRFLYSSWIFGESEIIASYKFSYQSCWFSNSIWIKSISEKFEYSLFSYAFKQ